MAQRRDHSESVTPQPQPQPLPAAAAVRPRPFRLPFRLPLSLPLISLSLLLVAAAVALLLAHGPSPLPLPLLSVMSAAAAAPPSAGAAGPDAEPRVVVSRPSAAVGSGGAAGHAHPNWVDEGPVATPAGPVGSGGGTESGGPLSAPGSSVDSLSFRVLLRQNRAQLEAVLNDVSDPRSSKYGRYLTADQLRELVSPPAEEQARVVRWLRRSLSLPAAAVVSHGDHVQVAGAAPAAVARTFGCAVHRFRFSEPQSQSQRHWPRQAEPRTGAAGAANPADQPPPPAPRYLLRCVGDVTVPAKFGGLVTGTLGLVEFPPQFHGGPFPHPQPSDLQPAEPLPHQPQPQPQSPADQQSRVDPQPQAEPRPPADDSRSHQQLGQAQGQGQGQADQADSAAEGQPQQQADATVADHDHDPAGPAGPAARRPLAHPPITFRTPEQLRRVALQFEREQLQRRPHDQPQH